MTKTFDTVNHEKIILKLKYYDMHDMNNKYEVLQLLQNS